MLIQADARQIPLADESVQCCVTSPPYWGLRCYGLGENELGLEKTPELYVEHIVAVFREVRRVLRDDGTVWLNLGDSYSRAPEKGGSGPGNKNNCHIDDARRIMSEAKGSSDGKVGRGDRAPIRNGAGNLKPKDLCGIPWRVAFALQADGWWLRSDIIWSKPNPMPESVTDRPTRSHEYLFLLAKSERYYFDQEAVREPLRPKTFTTFGIPMRSTGNDALGKVKSDNWGRTVAVRKPKMKKPDGWDTSPGGHGSFHRNGREKGKASEYDPKMIAGANIRSVWTIATQPFPDAHFATFPEALVKPCILAGCPEGGIVFDPFIGSGTVVKVAQDLGRIGIGLDMKPEYLAMAKKRTAQMGFGQLLAGD